ncbi:hypothetical protein LSAT2_003136, partial [Lamellibrachia satsuma]
MYLQKVVLDGRNGKVLWQMNATFYGMTSDLVMRTTEKHRDAFVFRIQGVNGPDMNTKKEKRQRRSSGEDFDKNNTALQTSHSNDAHKEFFNDTGIDDFNTVFYGSVQFLFNCK